MKPEEIKALRMAIGVSQEKFASLLGTTVVTINRWENGKTKPSRLYVRELKEVRNGQEYYKSRQKDSE
jgi:DNA-binding transcriptional regulator YiaG